MRIVVVVTVLVDVVVELDVGTTVVLPNAPAVTAGVVSAGGVVLTVEMIGGRV